MRKTFIFLLPVFAFSACSLNKIAVRQTAKILDSGIDAFYSETDLQLAREAMPANLKLMEALLENDPENTLLLDNLARGYCGYSFLFVEDTDKERASLLYGKGIGFARRSLKRKGLIAGGKIISAKINRKNAPSVFWNDFCESSWINLNMKDPDALARLPEIIPSVEKLKEVYPDYYYNGPYLILASYYAVRPRLLGGDPDKAKTYFDKAVSGAGSDFLLNKYIYAKIYSVLVQDEELFDRLIREILRSPAGSGKSLPLADEAAKKKAIKLKEMKDELF